MFVMERHRRLNSSNIVSLGVNINNDSNALLTHPLTIRLCAPLYYYFIV